MDHAIQKLSTMQRLRGQGFLFPNLRSLYLVPGAVSMERLQCLLAPRISHLSFNLKREAMLDMDLFWTLSTMLDLLELKSLRLIDFNDSALPTAHLEGDDYPYTGQLLRVLRSQPNLEALYLDEIELNSGMVQVFATLPRLISLRFSLQAHGMRVLGDLSQLCHGLKEVTVSAGPELMEDIIPALFPLHNLERLECRSWDDHTLPFDMIESMASAWPSMQNLSLQHLRFPYPAQYKLWETEMNARFPNMQALTLGPPSTHYDDLSDENEEGWEEWEVAEDEEGDMEENEEGEDEEEPTDEDTYSIATTSV